MKKLILLIVLLTATPVMSQTLSSDGYYYYEGYTTPYTRQFVQGYYRNGCYVQGYYQYSPFIAKAALTPPVYSSNWKTDALKYAEARDDYNAYLLTLKALGINGQILPYQAQVFGANASTNYSYSVQSLSQLYGDNNQAALQQAYAQNVQSALSLGDRALAGHQAILALDGGNRARVAEILAKGQAAAQVFNSLGTNTSTKITVGPAPAQTDDPALAEFQTLVGNKCASCHSGDTIKGKFDVSKYLELPQEMKENVWRRILSNDSKIMMPPTGPRLTPREMKLFAKY